MRVRVLGCSGGVGPGLRTTSLLVDSDVLIDAGSGVGELSVEEMGKIRHIFITHSHLDHVAFLPFLVDVIFEQIEEPLVVYGQEATLKALQDHIFNWTIWPDFSQLPTPERPVMRFEVVQPGVITQLQDKDIEMIPVSHTVPGVGYRISTETSALAFSGDTSTNDTLWQALNVHDNLDLLFIETAYGNRQLGLAKLAKHYCPSLLADDMKKLRHKPKVYLTHLKPGEETAILSEARELIPDVQIKALVGGEVFQL